MSDNSQTDNIQQAQDDARSQDRSPRRERRPSASPRREDPDARPRSRSPPRHRPRNDGSLNPGNNLYVTMLSNRTRESSLEEVFARYGRVERCSIVCDPHTRESRGFAFVTMEDLAAADAALDALNGYELDGRRITVEKARRARPRSPTPGEYRGPLKRDRPPPRHGGSDYDRRPPRNDYYDRYDRPPRDYDRRPPRHGGDYYDRYDRAPRDYRYEDRRAPASSGAAYYDDRRAGAGGYGGSSSGAPAADYGRYHAPPPPAHPRARSPY